MLKCDCHLIPQFEEKRYLLISLIYSFVLCRKDTVWLLALPKRFQRSRVLSLQQYKHFSEGKKKKKEKKVIIKAA